MLTLPGAPSLNTAMTSTGALGAAWRGEQKHLFKENEHQHTTHHLLML